MKEWILDKIGRLAPTSVVLFIGETVDIPHKERYFFSVDRDLRRGGVNGSGLMELEDTGVGLDRMLLDWMQREIFGKTFPESDPKRHFHFQIDLLYIGEGINLGDIGLLRSYMHPYGIISSPEHRQMGSNAMERDGIWYEVYRPELLYDIPFARLYQREKEWLYNTAKGLPKGAIYVEIGSYRGGSSAIIASANPDISVVCVDTWLGDETVGVHTSMNHFLRHTQYFDNIISVKVDIRHLDEGPRLISEGLGRDLEEIGIDLLFIDADHSYKSCLNDLRTYERYIKNGICSHHDAYFGEVKRAINHYFGNPIDKILARTKVGGWYATKRGGYVYGGRRDSSIWAIKIKRRNLEVV